MIKLLSLLVTLGPEVIELITLAVEALKKKDQDLAARRMREAVDRQILISKARARLKK